MTNVFVRSATVADLAHLRALNGVVQRLHVEAEPDCFRSGTDAGVVEAFFGKLLVDERMFLFIAERTERPIGYIWFEVQERLRTPFTPARKRIYVHHVVVDPGSRKCGVGSALLRVAETEARVRNIAELALDTWAFNTRAHSFFRFAGFKPFNIVMRKVLDHSEASAREQDTEGNSTGSNADDGYSSL